MLLIVTSRQDLASDYLIVRLEERNIRFLRVNTEDFPEHLEISLRNGPGGWGWSLTVDGSHFAAVDFSAAYLRHPVVASLEGLDERDREFAENEVAETLRSLWRLIPERLWLNHPARVREAGNKIAQLVKAQQLGFSVPKTLVSNSVEDVEKFERELGDTELVAKAVRHGFVETRSGTVLAGTQPFRAENLREAGVAQRLPLVVQERIQKQSDVRVVIVDDEAFATRILPSGDRSNEVDWRFAHLEGRNVTHESLTLSTEMHERCCRLPRSFGLRYASMDFMEDSAGTLWFLELNPNGQWAWIEQVTGQQIRTAIIRALGI